MGHIIYKQNYLQYLKDKVRFFINGPAKLPPPVKEVSVPVSTRTVAAPSATMPLTTAVPYAPGPAQASYKDAYLDLLDATIARQRKEAADLAAYNAAHMGDKPADMGTVIDDPNAFDTAGGGMVGPGNPGPINSGGDTTTPPPAPAPDGTGGMVGPGNPGPINSGGN